jgi:hypothetical protein
MSCIVTNYKILHHRKANGNQIVSGIVTSDQMLYVKKAKWTKVCVILLQALHHYIED